MQIKECYLRPTMLILLGNIHRTNIKKSLHKTITTQTGYTTQERQFSIKPLQFTPRNPNMVILHPNGDRRSIPTTSHRNSMDKQLQTISRK